jgi:hypothetical protein
MSQDNTVLTDLSVKDLFVPLLISAGEDLKFEINPVSENYLLTLLEASLFTDRVFAVNHSTGTYSEPMISERFLSALQEEQKSKKCALLKKLGDSILFRAGFFAEALKRKLSGLNYHIQMGSSVYSSLYSDSKNPVYEDLSLRFSGYVDLISNVGQKVNLKNREDVLTLFDRYIEAGSKGAESKLIKLGFDPVDIKKASNQ